MVPDNLRGEWQGDQLPSARTVFTSELLEQHRDALRGRGGPAVSAQRYLELLMKLYIDFTQGGARDTGGE